MTPKQVLFLLFCGVLLVVGAMTVKHYSSANQLFSDAYQPAVEAYRERQTTPSRMSMDFGSDRRSNEPSARGIRESEIYKSKGDGYSTY